MFGAAGWQTLFALQVAGLPLESFGHGAPVLHGCEQTWKPSATKFVQMPEVQSCSSMQRSKSALLHRGPAGFASMSAGASPLQAPTPASNAADRTRNRMRSIVHAGPCHCSVIA